jgi:hypothetical protein
MIDEDRSPASLIEVFWIEKYLTFSQSHDDQLVSTDCMFVAEYALRGKVSDAECFEATLLRPGEDQPIEKYNGSDALWCNRLWVNRKVRSFDTLDELENAYPATDMFYWDVSGPSIRGQTQPIRIGGAEAKTNIPRPHAMRLFQDQKRVVDYTAIDHAKPLVIEWDPFPEGASGSIVDDLIFLFVDDCHGKIVFFGGLPVDPDYITYRSTSATIPAGTLRPGEAFTIFFSQCRMVDQDDSSGLLNVAVNSFGVELDIRTGGTASTLDCPEPRLKAPFMWLRKTGPGLGLETWPTIVDGNHCAPEVVHLPQRVAIA